MKFTAEMLTGKSRSHLQNLPCPFSNHHFLQKDTLKAFQELQKSAVKNGFNLQPASSFRDFQRQQLIWNGKFKGERKVHDVKGNTLDLTVMSDWQKIEAILRFSALPGGSRHHWGTEIDVFDPDLLPQNQQLQLEPWEYDKGGYFADFSLWLQANLVQFDFALPFINMPNDKEIGREPWHISYLPVATKLQSQFTPEILMDSWQNEDIAGKDVLLEHLADIFKRFCV
ncbi:M15 family metallopeptidase [Mannheimia massilioguelmaensis]|uniref:M15 family metallopeptidase n=1 Tax=Mannheimia massilioguelmaensis TaxID=1604354 RepID=UPI0005C8FE2F|nr:M15 family metallopeptidase [Mannheimia massilioguelmaensis]